ncbi:co-chaperone HscB [Aestuariibacter halophilus]|uniref:Co-chaperone protein HscB homolog n=1 Tax=Fluctibacter halophilus TaxID=226011 RepID=A0ABS8G4B2_9ALTE|nr:co-chaperone HscB [Aestuariibacter halophilus]MCC2614946.1 co-chaperone HscB [Aestuariibacter halophilus]
MNFFSLYQLPEQFDIDLEQLNKAHKTLVKLTHPDRFATASERERLMAVQKNAQVNDGYSVLKSPVSRAEHLLSLRGVELRHEQQTMQDTAFLMQQMEWREALEDMASAPDEQQLTALDAELVGHINDHMTNMKMALDKNSDDGNQRGADEIRKLKFMLKLRAEIARLEDTLHEQ